MTINNASSPVVVGVDGSEHSVHTLEAAVDLAARRRWQLRVVHIVEPYVPDLPLPRRFGLADPDEVSAEILDRARRRVEDRAPELDVTYVSRDGQTARMLLEELTTGRMLVVGRRGHGRFTALTLGSTALDCASRSDRPVMIVPTETSAALDAPVVVGVDGSADGQAAVELAFAEAAARGTGLVVLHAWESPSPYSFDFAAVGGSAMWQVEHELAVAEVIAGWREKYPDVAVRTLIKQGHPAATLVELAAGAALLVVGGRGHSPFADVILGSVARAVAQHATCPVAVVHQPH